MELSYIEGHAAISQANRIFGYGNWSTEIVDGPTFHPDQKLYTVNVRVSVAVGDNEAYYTDVGSQLVTGDHETAFKGCVIDAEKRALRHLGEQFGNSLYDRAAIAREAGSAPKTTEGKELPPAVAAAGAVVTDKPGTKEDCPICGEHTVTPHEE